MTKEVKKEILEWVIDIGIAVVIALIIMAFIKPIIIQQSSMEPNFHSGEYVFVSRQSYTLFGDIEYGDVVIFRSELKTDSGQDKNLIKRIIGLPGDEIEIIDGYVYRNGLKLEEHYVAEEGMSGNYDKVVVGDNQVFAMGDNRRVSMDSRELGCVDQDEIIGRVVLRFLPLNKITVYHQGEY